MVTLLVNVKMRRFGLQPLELSLTDKSQYTTVSKIQPTLAPISLHTTASGGLSIRVSCAYSPHDYISAGDSRSTRGHGPQSQADTFARKSIARKFTARELDYIPFALHLNDRAAAPVDLGTALHVAYLDTTPARVTDV